MAVTLGVVHRILILDSETAVRSELIESVLSATNTEAVLVASEDELLSRIKFGLFAAVFADIDLLSEDGHRLIGAVRSARPRPMLVIGSDSRIEDLDPDVVTLVLRKPYDVKILTGVLLSAIIQAPSGVDGDTDWTSVC